MNKDNCSFEDWHEYLCVYAIQQDGAITDADAWREDYEAGKTPEQAWHEVWG